MENVPFVSVVVPVYNSEATISECIESLLNQDYAKERYEIIAVDNASKDKSAPLIKGFPVAYTEERVVRSSYAARNRGIRQAQGDILAFTDADCIVSRDWLRKGVEALCEDAHIGCVAGEVRTYKPQTYVEKYLRKKDIFSQEKNAPEFPLHYAKIGNAFYKKEVFTRIGFFEERWVSGGDADLSWRMQLETRLRIAFSHDAIVFHKHRTTLQTMFRQSMKYGIGYSLLCKKYRDKMPSKNSKQVVWVFYRLFHCLLRAIAFFFYKKESMSEEKRDAYLDSISFMGWEIGRIIGSVRNHVFAV